MVGWPQVRVFVEIKRESIAIHGVDAIMERVLRLLAPVRKRCILISFDLDLVRAVAEDGLLATGWVLDAYDQATISMARQFGPDYMIVDYCRVKDASRLAEGDWQWMVYLVNEPGIAASLSGRNVQLVETSDICAMLGQA